MAKGVLLRHRDFRLLWGGETVSELGSQVSLLAVPLLAVRTLHATAVRDGAADRRVDRRVPRRRAPGRRVGRPDAPAPRHDRRGPRSDAGPGLGPGRLRRRRAHLGPALRRHTGQRDPHRLLRRRLPVVPACARGAGAPGRGQRQVDRQRTGGRGGRPERRRRPRPGHRQLGRGGRRLGQLPRLRGRRHRHPHPRAQTGGTARRGIRSSSTTSPRVFASCSAMRSCVPSRPPRPPRTCSAASLRRSRSSSWCARCTPRRG